MKGQQPASKNKAFKQKFRAGLLQLKCCPCLPSFSSTKGAPSPRKQRLYSLFNRRRPSILNGSIPPDCAGHHSQKKIPATTATCTESPTHDGRGACATCVLVCACAALNGNEEKRGRNGHCELAELAALEVIRHGWCVQRQEGCGSS